MDIGIAGADFDNQEAHKTYPIGLPSPLDDALLFHRQCYDRGIACGFIHPEDDLSRLRALYVPHWVMWKPEWTTAVDAFVKQGGTLILSAMTATRDVNNHIHRSQAPSAGLSQLAGVRVQEFGVVAAPGALGLFDWPQSGLGIYRPTEKPAASSASRIYNFTFGNQEFVAGHLYERLELNAGTEVIGRWSNRFLQDEAMMTTRRHGKGHVIYMGTYLTPEFTAAMVSYISTQHGILPLLADKPDGVEVSIRENDERKICFIQNTLHTTVTIAAVPHGIDLLTGKHINGALDMEAYGCAVIRMEIGNE